MARKIAEKLTWFSEESSQVVRGFLVETLNIISLACPIRRTSAEPPRSMALIRAMYLRGSEAFVGPEVRRWFSTLSRRDFARTSGLKFALLRKNFRLPDLLDAGGRTGVDLGGSRGSGGVSSMLDVSIEFSARWRSMLRSPVQGK